MRRIGTSNEELDNTAQFKSESPKESPRSLELALEDIPRIATSFLHAFMQTYDVDVQRKAIIFPDYLEQLKVCNMPLTIVQAWIVQLHTCNGAIAIDPSLRDADQRDLQTARVKLSKFIQSADLLPDHVVKTKLTKLLRHNRELRLTAFAKGSMQDILEAKSLPVCYDQLPKDLKKNGSFKKNKSGCINI